MTLINDDQAVILKTRELCQTLAEQAEFRSIYDRLQAFMADEAAQALLNELENIGQNLHYKQQMNMSLTPEEIAAFESRRDAVLANPVCRGFLEAQEEMQAVRQRISHYVMKTFELGRLPEPSDFHQCGSGCSCG